MKNSNTRDDIRTPVITVQTAKEKIMDLKNWTVRTRDIETGHEFYAPNDDLAPIVLGYGKYYRVIGFWAIAGKVLWLDLFRTNKEGVVVNATLSPDELMGMDLGLCDEIELHKLLNKQIVSEYFNEYPITESERNQEVNSKGDENDQR